jgi:hypothetical protein
MWSIDHMIRGKCAYPQSCPQLPFYTVTLLHFGNDSSNSLADAWEPPILAQFARINAVYTYVLPTPISETQLQLFAPMFPFGIPPIAPTSRTTGGPTFRPPDHPTTLLYRAPWLHVACHLQVRQHCHRLR